MKLRKEFSNPRLVEVKPGEYTFCVDSDLVKVSKKEQHEIELYLVKKGREFIKELQGSNPEVLSIHEKNFKRVKHG